MPTAVPAGSPAGANGSPGPVAIALGAAASATTLVSLWLAFTVVAVLPARDPGHVGFWACVTAGLLVFAAVSFLALRSGRLGAGATLLAAVLGVAATGLGLGSILHIVTRSRGGFEGYIIVIGAVLAAHGLLAIGHALWTPSRPS
jgi:hypothetical protein